MVNPKTRRWSAVLEVGRALVAKYGESVLPNRQAHFSTTDQLSKKLRNLHESALVPRDRVKCPCQPDRAL